MNRLNVWGWANLGARTVSNFGLLMLVSSLGTPEDVGLWLVAITVLAAVGTLDGLLGQYFMRAFVWMNIPADLGQNDTHRLQDRVYSALALMIGVIGAYMLRGLGAVPALFLGVLFALLLLARRLDSRTRAASDLTQYQRVEALFNCLAVFLGLVVFVSTQSLVLLLAGYLGWLAIASLLKYRILYRPVVFSPASGMEPGPGGSAVRSDLTKTILVSLSGALTINLCLLLVSDGLGSAEAATLLLSYRLAMLVCEFASVPIVTRLPQLTRHAQSQGRLSEAFPRLGAWGLGLTLVGLGGIAVAAPWGFGVLNLDLSVYGLSPIGLVLIGAWFVERANTFLSQALLCSGFFQHAVAFSSFAVVMLVAAIGARQASAPHAFVIAQLLAGAALLPLVVRYYIGIVGFPRWRSA